MMQSFLFSQKIDAEPMDAFTDVKAEDLALVNNLCYEISDLRKSRE